MIRPVIIGDIILVYATGLGQTTPPMITGRIIPDATYKTATTTATIGGVAAEVIYSIASPGFVGLYQTALRVPAGTGTGNRPVILSVGTATSNTAQIAIQ